VFPSKNAPTSDVRERLAEAVMDDERVRGVGWQKITFGENWHLAMVLKAKKRFGKVVIENALNECGLEDKVEGYGLLKLTTGAASKPLKLIKGDISTIKPGPKKAAKPDHDSSTSEDDEPRKRKAHKRQRRPQRAKQQGGRIAAAAEDADTDSGGESDRGKQMRIAGKAAAAAVAPQRTEDVAALQQVQAIATQLGIAASSTDFVNAIKALQDGTAAAQRERAEALVTSQTAADSIAELQVAVSAGQKEKHDLDVRACQLSAENANLKAKLSTAKDQLTSSETALASVRAELKQKSDANAVLTADNIEFEKMAAASAESTALLSKKLCSALAMLKEVLPDEVRATFGATTVVQYYCMLDTGRCIIVTCDFTDVACRCTVHITLH
jgi:hypothetical protein